MKTIVIWNEFGENKSGKLQYFVLDGNMSKFDNVYVNTFPQNPVHQETVEELYDVVYDDDGNVKVEFLVEFPTNLVKTEECIVIEAGFIP